ncbi:MAG: TSUP family transporter [Luteitalea sp.]|nr:TSUP family transporter [Luteitalea sp.]
MTALSVLFVMGGGVVAGVLGALLGLGGGVFLVPLLTLGLGLPFRHAAAISLLAVIATSSMVTAGSAGRRLINVRLGMVLEIATTLGGLAGGLTALTLSHQTLSTLFGIVTVLIAIVMLHQRNELVAVLDEAADPGWLGGRFYSYERGRHVTYRIKRMPVALGMSFLAGNVSGLLGIGGGILKVPALNVWCGVPMRVAAATSSLMIGVTAVATVPLYYAHGDVVPHLAAAAVLGVLAGSRAGLWVGDRARAKWLKVLLACVLLAVSILMFVEAR